MGRVEGDEAGSVDRGGGSGGDSSGGSGAVEAEGWGC